MSPNLALGGSFVLVGILTATLQYWLWTFPMVPDASGSDPNGVTTAPVLWRNVHRMLGYVFTGIYVTLLFRMLPRLPFLTEETASPGTWVHIALGFVIAPLLVAKVVILRRIQRLGKYLLHIGSALLVCAIANISLVLPNAVRLATLPVETDSQAPLRLAIQRECTSCHGASPILVGSEEPWEEVVSKMQKLARKSGKSPPLQSNLSPVLAYLQWVLPSEEKSRRRKRGRRSDESEDSD